MKCKCFMSSSNLTAGFFKATNLLKVCSIFVIFLSVNAFADDSFFNSSVGANDGNDEAMVTDFYGNPMPAHGADYYNHLINNAADEQINALDKKADEAKNNNKINKLQQKVLSESVNNNSDQHNKKALQQVTRKPRHSLAQPQHKMLAPPPQPEVIYRTPMAKQQGNATNFSSAASGQQQISSGLGIQY